jgi:signal transduction histidine kinase/CheY-like chemotaxis protein
MAITLLGTAYTQREVEKEGEEAFASTCKEIGLKIEERLLAHKQMLRGGAGLFNASDDISREQWSEYANTISFREWFPGLQGLGFSRLIPELGLARHIEEVRAEGFPNYRVWPEGKREIYSSIIYLEPFSGSNLRAFGFDMLSEPVRRAAMEKARDEEVAALSGKVTLVQETGLRTQAGTLMYFPVYGRGLPHKTVEERRRSIIGWVYCPFRMDDFMVGILGKRNQEADGQIRFRIYDGDLVSSDTRLYDSMEANDSGRGQAPRFSLKISMDSAARPWTLLFTQSNSEALAPEYGKIWLAFFGGTIADILLFWLILSLLNTSFTARRMADRLNATLLELNTELEQRVAKRTAELENAKAVAEDANKAKSDFLSSMSHELRTPMNAVLGFGQLLEQDEGLKPSHLEFVQEIMKAGRHLLDLINEVLDLSRIESGKIELSSEPVSCEDLIKEGLDLIAPLAEKRGIRIGRDVSATPTVMADRVRLKQALVNLLSNAVKYNSEAGSIRVILSKAGEMARIEVSDTGNGIPADRMPELFTPFNRLGRDSGEIEGTGIGLVISKRLIECMGGSIGAESEEGRGSRFWIELPTAVGPERREGGPGENEKTEEIGSASSPPETRHTVLYIEDNPANLRLVGRIFAMRGNIRFLTAHTPALGLELAEARRPELILLDLNMPEMDGYGVLKRLRASEWGKDIPVIAVTALAMPHDIERGKAAGFSEYLTKPLDVPGFLAAVDRQLAGESGEVPMKGEA